MNFCYFVKNYDHLSLLCYSTENVTIMVTETLIPEVVTVTQLITTNKMATTSPLVDAQAMASWMLIAIALSGALLVVVILLALLATSLLCLCLQRRKKSEVHESKDPQG